MSSVPNRSYRFDGLIIKLVLLFLISAKTIADEPVQPAQSVDAVEGAMQRSDAPLSLPKSLEPFRQIYFFQSQAAELLPPTFRPIDVSELDQRLSRRQAGPALPIESPQLIRGVYVASLVKDRLVSTRSYWDVSYRGEGATRLNLGKLGFALRPENDESETQDAGQIVSDLSGAASVLMNADGRLGFSWTASGKPIDRGILFDLQIPSSIQTRLLINVPSDVVLQAVDGVGRSLPSPPSEADFVSKLAVPDKASTSWYSIDAGGLTRVRLRMVNNVQQKVESVLPIRQASIQYDVMPQSIHFVTRLLVDSRSNLLLPILSIDHGQVTSVRVGGSTVPWSEVSTSQGVGIRIDTSRLDLDATFNTLNITIEGECAWNATGSTQSLPWPRWQGCKPILIATEMQAQVRLASELSAYRLQLPPRWQFSPTAIAEEGAKLFRAVGPMLNEGISLLVKPDAQQNSADSILRLTATSTRFQAQLDSSILVSDVGPQPIQIVMDRNWTADLVTLPRSGRVIDLPNDPALRRIISIWPTSDELVGGRFLVRVSGSMPLRSVANRIEFPATSFATVQNCRNRVTAMVTPPLGFNWSGDVALRTTRVTTNQLSATQREMLGELGEDSLLIEVNEGRLAPLICRQPDIAFDATSRFALRIENDRLVETYLVACDSTSTEIQSIIVDLGDASGRLPMQWSALRLDGSSRRISSTSRLQSEDSSGSRDSSSGVSADPSELWRIELGETGERSVMLIGRREYRFEGVKEIALPRVPGAANQTAQVIVMPPLHVAELTGSVMRVPRPGNQKVQLSQYGAVSTDTNPVVGATVLRHEAIEKATIKLALAARPQPSPMIWQESVQIIASNRGGDILSAYHDVRGAADLAIEHDVSLRLVSVVDQTGKELEYESEPTLLTVKIDDSVTQVASTWTRSVFSGSIVRTWGVPRLQAMGTVLNRDWRMIPAPDTLIPSSLFFGTTKSLGSVFVNDANVGKSVDPFSGESYLIVDSGLGYALASMIGLCLFGFGWWIASRSPLVAAIVWCCSSLPPLFLFATATLWLSAVCVPFAAGCLLSLTLYPAVLRRSDAMQTTIPTNRPKPSRPGSVIKEGSSISPHGSSRGGTYSWTGRLPLWLWLSSIAIGSLLTCSSGMAQLPQPVPLFDTREPILVPTTAEGEIAGTKVYVPQSLYADLFRERLPVLASVRMRSANYRLRLTGLTESGVVAELEARYLLDETLQRTEVRLPFRSTQLRSVQWLTDVDTRPLRWSADGVDGVRLTLPAAKRASLLIRAGQELEVPSRSVRKVRFPIPPIANSTLLVDAGLAVQRLELAESIGEIDTQPELGRLNAAIGAVNNVDLTITYREAARTIPSITHRRYWVHAGYDQTTVECEIEHSDVAIRKGSEVPVVLLDGELPLMTTADWVILATETLSPVRKQLLMQAQRDDPGPIRFLWELNSVLAIAQELDTATGVVLPEVLSAGSGTTPPAIIALNAAQGLRLLPRQTQQPPSFVVDGPTVKRGEVSPATASLEATTNPELIESFIASWKGFRGTANEIVTALSPLTRFVIVAPVIQPWQSDEVHHLHVRPGELQLSYTATVTPGDQLMGPLRLVLPLDSELRVLTVNGATVGSVPHRLGNRNEVSLPEAVSSDTIRIRAVIHKRISQDERFRPPRISLEPFPVVRGTYTLSRDQSLLVEEVVEGGLVETSIPLMGTDELLSGGWVPCWTWRLDQIPRDSIEDLNSQPQLPGRFRVLNRDITISSQQRTSLVWDQTRWSFEAVLRLQSAEKAKSDGSRGREPIDFVNVELPTIWCENLTVEPAEQWSRQPSIDPATQIVRIRPKQTAETAAAITIRLKGNRDVDSDSRLEVPSVRVLGGGRREVFITVPKRIDGRVIDWEAVAAMSARLPEPLADVESEPVQEARSPSMAKRIFNPKNELVFRSVAGNSSVRLAPSRLEVTSPTIAIADFQLFASAGSKLAMTCRWDLFPGREDELAIAIPSGVEPIEVWIDNEPAEWTVNDNKDELRLKLALSRLAQSVVLICKLDTKVNKKTLPKIQELPVGQSWLTIYQSKESDLPLSYSTSSDSQWVEASDKQLYLARAKAIREVTELSLTRATDRSQEEIMRWLAPWSQKFSNLKALSESQSPSSNEGMNNAMDQGVAWTEQESKWNQYQRRIAGEVLGEEGDRAHLFVPPADWRIAKVVSHPGSADSMPGIRILESARTLSLVIQSVITLFIAGGITVLMWRSRKVLAPFVDHPAVWMFVTGLASLAVAPVPVAIAICLVAISAPLLNSATPSRQRR